MKVEQSLNRRLTESVRGKIAFEVFRSNDTYTEIAERFGISRTTVKKIADEYDVARVFKSKPSGFTKNMTKAPYNRNIETINWTFDDNLIKERIRRRESVLITTVHSAMKELARLS